MNEEYDSLNQVSDLEEFDEEDMEDEEEEIDLEQPMTRFLTDAELFGSKLKKSGIIHPLIAMAVFLSTALLSRFGLRNRVPWATKLSIILLLFFAISLITFSFKFRYYLADKRRSLLEEKGERIKGTVMHIAHKYSFFSKKKNWEGYIVCIVCEQDGRKWYWTSPLYRIADPTEYLTVGKECFLLEKGRLLCIDSNQEEKGNMVNGYIPWTEEMETKKDDNSVMYSYLESEFVRDDSVDSFREEFDREHSKKRELSDTDKSVRIYIMPKIAHFLGVAGLILLPISLCLFFRTSTWMAEGGMIGLLLSIASLSFSLFGGIPWLIIKRRFRRKYVLKKERNKDQ